jgi:lysozyme
MAKKIIDVSHHNGTIDWNATKTNIDGAIIAVGYGSNDPAQDDKQFRRNISECEQLKIPHAVYIFSYAENMAMVDSEIDQVLRLISGHKDIHGVYYDIELPCCARIAAQAYRRFADRIKAAGYTPGLYTYASMYHEYNMSVIHPERLWIASYGNNNNVAEPWEDPHLPGTAGWQYTSTDRIPGIVTNVDVSLFYKDFEQKPDIILPDAPKGSMYRLWAYPNRHLWTEGRREAQCLLSQGWRYEGIGWKTPVKGDPVYRMYHVATKNHLLTPSTTERDHLSKAGWKYEGIACFSEKNKEKRVPVHRLSYGPAHMYTTSTHEVEGLKRAGWTDEHVSFYGTK